MDLQQYSHQSVLLREVIEGLAIVPDGIYIDATYGRGGHSSAILKRLDERGRLLAIDKDPQAIDAAQQRHIKDSRFSVVQCAFNQIAEVAKKFDVLGQVSGILLDLGVSSPQLDDAERGFSFMQEGPLDMRMDPHSGLSVAQWLQQTTTQELAHVLKEYGEERFAKRIANAILTEQAKQPIVTTKQLADIIVAANPSWEKHKHPATRSFQALRIFINSELDELQQCLQASLDVLTVGGKLAVISFHSLEDRIVKQFFQQQEQGTVPPKGLALTDKQMQDYRGRFKRCSKAIKPTDEEIAVNPRSRSAILRIGEKIA